MNFASAHRRLPLLLAAALASATPAAQAAQGPPPATNVSCTFGGGMSSAPPETMTLNATTLSVGPDVAPGTVIYRQSFRPSPPRKLTCMAPSGWFTVLYYAVLTGNAVLAPWQGGEYSGYIYSTGVPGIGIVIKANGGNNTANAPYTLPRNTPIWSIGGIGSPSTKIIEYAAAGEEVMLVRTGETATPNGTIIGANLPGFRGFYTVDGHTGKNEWPIVTFTGSIHIVSRTCTINNRTVALGSYKPRDFSGPGTATSWKDASIQLTNCPAFHGYVDADGVPTNNSLSLRLSPADGFWDVASGIMNLTPGPNTAVGIGVQLGYTNDGTDLVDFGQTRTIPLAPTNVDGGTLRIPLYARYIQTAPDIRAGSAGALLRFTIQYY